MKPADEKPLNRELIRALGVHLKDGLIMPYIERVKKAVRDFDAGKLVESTDDNSKT